MWLRSSGLPREQNAWLLLPETQSFRLRSVTSWTMTLCLLCLLRGKGSCLLWAPSKFPPDSLTLKDTAAEHTAVSLATDAFSFLLVSCSPQHTQRNQQYVGLCLQEVTPGNYLLPGGNQCCFLCQPFLLPTWPDTVLVVYLGRVASSQKWAPQRIFQMLHRQCQRKNKWKRRWKVLSYAQN